MLKILLDIDGVMVTTPTWRQPAFLADGFMAFDEHCAKNLANLLEQNPAEIVLSSTHRIHYDEATWQILLVNRGIKVNNVSKIDTINHYADFQSRDKEILAWINANPYEKFIIIDDDKSLRNLPSDTQKFWVETQFLTGFDTIALKKAYEILKLFDQNR